MKRYADDREEALVALLKRFYAGEITDGALLRALRRDVLGLKTKHVTPLWWASVDERCRIWKAIKTMSL